MVFQLPANERPATKKNTMFGTWRHVRTHIVWNPESQGTGTVRRLCKPEIVGIVIGEHTGNWFVFGDGPRSTDDLYVRIKADCCPKCLRLFDELPEGGA